MFRSTKSPRVDGNQTIIDEVEIVFQWHFPEYLNGNLMAKKRSRVTSTIAKNMVPVLATMHLWMILKRVGDIFMTRIREEDTKYDANKWTKRMFEMRERNFR